MDQRVDSVAPCVPLGARIVLFDGVCRLCSAWARFLIKHDHPRQFQLATVQSPEGQSILASFGLSTECFETMVLIDHSKLYVRSTSFVRVVGRLGFPFNLVALIGLIPAPVRDWLYDRIALNRYRLFGRHPECLLPTADHATRFLGAGTR